MSLFEPDESDSAGASAPRANGLALEVQHAAAAELANRLPPEVLFGTSSWSFPGWAGLVYSEPSSTTELARHGLREYATHPLLRTVGIDRSYYGPIPDEDLRRYADQLPDGFRCCAKAPAVVTSVVLPEASRGRPAVANPDFLSAERFMDELLEPCARWFADHTGPFVIECPPAPASHRLTPQGFEERLDGFLASLPAQFEYAVELRDRSLLTRRYGEILESRGVGHVYNYWRAMPLPGEQAAVVPPERLPFAVVRLLMPPGTSYEQLRGSYRPFDRIVRPDVAMREDVVRLVTRSARGGRRAYVLVNNKAEGSAPLTIRALAERAARA